MPARPWRPAPRIVLVAALLLSGLGAGGWYYVSGTPTYSLHRLAVAVDARDVAEAERYIDVDRVADEAADTVIEELLKGPTRGASSDPWKRLGERLAAGFVEAMKPVIKARYRDELRARVRKAIEEGQRAGGALTLPVGFLAIMRRATIERDGEVARVTVWDDAGRPAVKFRMARHGRRWRIVAMDPDWLRAHLPLGK